MFQFITISIYFIAVHKFTYISSLFLFLLQNYNNNYYYYFIKKKKHFHIKKCKIDSIRSQICSFAGVRIQELCRYLFILKEKKKIYNFFDVDVFFGPCKATNAPSLISNHLLVNKTRESCFYFSTLIITSYAKHYHYLHLLFIALMLL